MRKRASDELKKEVAEERDLRQQLAESKEQIARLQQALDLLYPLLKEKRGGIDLEKVQTPPNFFVDNEAKEFAALLKYISASNRFTPDSKKRIEAVLQLLYNDGVKGDFNKTAIKARLDSEGLASPKNFSEFLRIRLTHSIEGHRFAVRTHGNKYYLSYEPKSKAIIFFNLEQAGQASRLVNLLLKISVSPPKEIEKLKVRITEAGGLLGNVDAYAKIEAPDVRSILLELLVFLQGEVGQIIQQSHTYLVVPGLNWEQLSEKAPVYQADEIDQDKEGQQEESA